MLSSRRALVATLLLLLAACHPEFQVTKYPTNEALYRAAMEEFSHGRWDNAVSAFENSVKPAVLALPKYRSNLGSLQDSASDDGLQGDGFHDPHRAMLTPVEASGAARRGLPGEFDQCGKCVYVGTTR